MSSAASSTKNATGAKLRIFFDSDVLIAGSASKTHSSASYILLQLAELTLIEGIISSYVQEETERNLLKKLPHALPMFRLLIQNSLQVVSDPKPALIKRWKGRADAKDLPMLVAAATHKCNYLVTFNLADYKKPPTQFEVIAPGELVMRVREHLVELSEQS